MNTEKNRTGARSASPTVEAYDFRRPTTLAREHSRVLELAFDSFARQWGTQLTSKVRAKTTVTSDSVAMQTYDEYVTALPATTAMVLSTVEGSESKAVMQFPIVSALNWISRELGGNGSHKPPERKFTQIEHALVYRLTVDALDDLKYSMGNLLTEHQLSVESIQHNSQFAQAAATTDLMIVATFTITVGDDEALSTIALPADVILQQLGALNPMDTNGDADELIRGQLGDVPVSVGLRITPIAVNPGVILNLQVGDVISLPHQKSEPFHVSVEDRSLYRAAVGTNGSRLAAYIVSTEENPK